MFLIGWFVTFIYQPFFNLLVGVYLLLDAVTGGNADMGVAVIIFTVVFRILWLPISLASGRTYNERLEISKRAEKLEDDYKHDPIRLKFEMKHLFKGNKRVVFSSAVNIILQTIIALMLYRIFTKGLEGEDFHLLYKFVPDITKPFNLVFMGKYDLTRPNITLNLIQSLVIFIYESMDALFSSGKRYRREVLMAQFVLPLVSFLIFFVMPAGKKMFIITTICFSIVLKLIQQILFWVKSAGEKIDKLESKAVGKKEADEAKEQSESGNEEEEKKKDEKKQ